MRGADPGDAPRSTGSALPGSGPDAILVLDGGIEHELARRGVVLRPSAGAAPLPVREPEAVRHLHVDVAIAGADVLTAATGETHRRALARIGESRRAREWTELAVRLVREAADAAGEAGRSVRSLPDGSPRPLPIAGLIEPLGGRGPAEAAGDGDDDEFRSHAGTLTEAGVGLLRLEGMRSIRECDAALAAAVATGLPVWAGIRIGTDGTTLWSGEPLEALLELVARHGPRALILAGPTNEAAARAVDELGRHDVGALGVHVQSLARRGEEPPIVVLPLGRSVAVAQGERRRNGSDGAHGTPGAGEREDDPERREEDEGGAAARVSGEDGTGARAGDRAGEETDGNGAAGGGEEGRGEEGALDSVASRLVEHGATLIGPGDDGSPARVATLRAAADRAEDLIWARMAAERAAWAAWLDEGARRAGGGRALWMQSAAASEPPPGMAWQVVDRTELHRMPDAHYGLVAADARGLAVPDLRRLVDLMEPGGWLLVAAAEAQADVLRADGRLGGLAPAAVDPPGARGWLGRRRH